MILRFIHRINGKPTHSIAKIWKGIKENISRELFWELITDMDGDEMTRQYPVDKEIYQKVLAKLHTIRRDSKKRWKVGSRINFTINFRGNKNFQFAPILKVVSTQEFEIKSHHDVILLYIDKVLFFYGNTDFKVNELENNAGMLKLAQNDGFNNIEDFFGYFGKKYKGKIIHWTNLKY